MTRTRLDRSPRPTARGWIHLVSSGIFFAAGVVLVICAFLWTTPTNAAAVIVYALGVTFLFGVSAAYHRGPWATQRTVTWWRRADHATIGIFIAASYTPLCVMTLPGATSAVILSVAWAMALAIAFLNLVWVAHPRWLATLCYLVEGWLIVPVLPQLVRGAGWTVVWLLAAGGILYTLGAVVYALKWPGKNARHMGFHEYFHAATVVAALLHYIAIFIVVREMYAAA